MAWVIGFGIVITITLLTIMIHVFGPKDFWRTRMIEFLLRKSTISLIVSIFIISFCFTYSNNWSDPISDSQFKQLIDFIFFIPVLIPFGIGFSEGDGISYYLSILIEIIILSLIIWALIPKKRLDAFRMKLKK